MDLLVDYVDFVARKINNMYADADIMSQSNIFRRNFYVPKPPVNYACEEWTITLHEYLMRPSVNCPRLSK